MTYLMWKRGVGFRVGTSRTYTAGAGQARRRRRLSDEAGGRGRGLGCLCARRATLRLASAEHVALGASTGCRRIPFNARPAGPGVANSLVGDQTLIDRVFSVSRHSWLWSAAARRGGTESSIPSLRRRGAHIGQAAVRLVCGAAWCSRFAATAAAARAMHRHLDVRIRRARGGRRSSGSGSVCVQRDDGSTGWRYETASMRHARPCSATVERVRGELDVQLQLNARLARNPEGVANSLPFMPASSVRPGMVMVDRRGRL